MNKKEVHRALRHTSNFNILYGKYYQSNLRFKTVEKP